MDRNKYLLIEQIVNKLIAEGLKIEDYCVPTCLSVCSNCVGINQIKFAFENWHAEIKKEFIKVKSP